MDIEMVQKLMAACHEAERITERIPELPGGMPPVTSA